MEDAARQISKGGRATTDGARRRVPCPAEEREESRWELTTVANQAGDGGKLGGRTSPWRP